MLGFVLFAIVFAQKSHYLSCAIAFTLSLMFKQMALYYSPAFFFYLIGQCFAKRSFSLFLKISFVTAATFVACLIPFLASKDFDVLYDIFRRVFPLHRGLFEGKVANFWCSSSVLFKIRNYFDVNELFSLW